MTASRFDEVMRLFWCGFVPVPACAPTNDPMRCSVSWHQHAPKDIGKVPLTPGYPKFAVTPPGPTECLQFFDVPFVVNVGVVVPVGLLVIDADSEEADREVLGLVPTGYVTPMRLPRPTRGRCLITRLSSGMTVTSMTKRGRSRALDLLGAGSFFIVPPSISASGHVYAWAEGAAPDQVPVAPIPYLLAEAVKRWGGAQGGGPPVSRLWQAAGPRDVDAGRRLVRARVSLRHLYEGVKDWGDNSESGVDFSFALEALRQRLKPEVVVALLAERPGVHREEEGYLVRTVARAQTILRGRR